MSKRIRVGLVAWNALPAIIADQEGARTGTFGGMETAMWTLAKHLAAHPDLEVSAFVMSDTDRPDGARWPEQIQNVHLRVMVDRHRRIRRQVSECIDVPGRRLIRWDARLLWQVPWLALTKPFRQPDTAPCRPDPRLMNQPIDHWIAFGNHADTSRVVATALHQQIPCAISVQSNSDVDPGLAREEEADEANDYGERSEPRRFSLLQASDIWCQTDVQKDMLASGFGLKSHVVRNPIRLSDWQSDVQKDEPSSVLWIGRYDDFHKRPLLMLDAIRACPDISFTMIINPLDPDIERRVRRELPPNVQIVDRVSFDQMPNVFRQSRMFVSTGDAKYEGFPNVLLQAAASDVPIVSLVDHDGFLSRSGAGVACDGSVEKLASEIQRLWREDNVDHEQVRTYLRLHHDADQIARRVRQFILDAVRTGPPNMEPTGTG